MPAITAKPHITPTQNLPVWTAVLQIAAAKPAPNLFGIEGTPMAGATAAGGVVGGGFIRDIAS